MGIGALAWCSALPQAAQAGSATYVRRPLAEALEDLRARGVNLIYSSDLVRPDMIVQSEPPASSPRQILDQLIAPFGLESQEGPGETVLIVLAQAPLPSRGGIGGRVQTRGEGRPVADAQILVVGAAIGATSGTDGRFHITGISPGTYTVEVRAPGLSAQRFGNVRVVAGDITEVCLDLAIVSTLREKIQVDSGPTPPGGDQPEPRITLDQKDLERRSRLGDDLNRAIAGSPGIVTGDKSAALGIRGGDPSETLLILDGLEIDEPLHLKDFLGFSSIIDSKTIGRADILSGGFPAEYGDHLSGVIDLSSADPMDRHKAVLSASFVDSSLLTGGAFNQGDGRWLVSARTWYPDALLDIVDPGGEDISPVYHDAMGKAELRLGGGTLLTGHVLATRDEVDFVNDPGNGSVTASNSSEYVWLNLKSPWTPRLYSRTVLSRGRVARNRAGSLPVASTGSAQVADERSFTSYGLAQEWMFQSSDRALARWGFSAKRLEAEYGYSSHTEGVAPLFGGAPTATDRALAFRPAGMNYGAYITHRVRLLPSLTAEAGARFDLQSPTGESQISPRMNLVFAPGPRNALRVAWGRFSQSQGIHELQVEDGERGFFPAQHAEHRVVGFDHVFLNGPTLSLNAYSKETFHVRPRYENLFNPFQIFPEVEPDRVRIAPSHASAKGVECFLSLDRGRPLAWTAGYTLSSAEDEVDGRMVPRSWDQRHTFHFDVNYRRNDAWNFNVAGVYHTGWPTTTVEAESVPGPDGSPTVRPILGLRNAARFPPYHRLDVKASRRIHFDRGTLTAFLEVTNLYGRDNVCCVEEFRFVPRPDGSVEVEREEGFWLKQLPVLGLTWEFGR